MTTEPTPQATRPRLPGACATCRRRASAGSSTSSPPCPTSSAWASASRTSTRRRSRRRRRASARSGRAAPTTPPTTGRIELRVALAEHLERLYGVATTRTRDAHHRRRRARRLRWRLAPSLDPGDEVSARARAYVAYSPAVIFAGGTPGLRAHLARGRLAARRAAVEAAITPRTQGLLPGLSRQPHGRGAEPGDLRAIAEIAGTPRPARDQRRDLRPARLRRPPHTLLQRAARHARADDPAGRLLQGLRHDRLAHRLRLRARGPPGRRAQGPPVHHHVRADDRPGRGPGGARPRPSRTSSGWSPSTTAAAGCSWTASTRIGLPTVRAARRLLRLPAIAAPA